MLIVYTEKATCDVIMSWSVGQVGS